MDFIEWIALILWVGSGIIGMVVSYCIKGVQREVKHTRFSPTVIFLLGPVGFALSAADVKLTFKQIDKETEELKFNIL